MTEAQRETPSAQLRLTHNSVAIDCARAANGFLGTRAEVVVPDEGRVYVVAGTDPNRSNLPRPMNAAEYALFDTGTDGDVSIADGSVSVAIRGRSIDSDHETIDGTSAETKPILAALSVSIDGHDKDTLPLDGIRALARMIETDLQVGLPKDSDFFHDVVQGQRDPVAVIDQDGEVVFMSDGVGSLLGLSPQELVGFSAAEILHPDDIGIALEAITRVHQGLEVFRTNVRMRDSREEYIPVEITGTDLSENPTVGGIVLTLRDAQRHFEQSRSRSRSQQLSDTIVASLRDGVIATDEFGAIVKINDTARSMFSLDPSVPPAQLKPEQFRLFTVDGRSHDPFSEQLEHDPLTASCSSADSPVCCLVSDNGDTRFLSTSCQPIFEQQGTEQLLGRVIVFSDVTREYVASQELRTQALHDQLTGLANRRQLDERLQELATSGKDVSVAACFIDLDGFKLVNDVHGHSKGDQLVRVAASRLARQLRPNDLLVRQGGDEFVALLVDIDDLETASQTAERCRKALSAPYILDAQRFDITGSIGVAISKCKDLDPSELLQHADLALYAAKDLGRNRVELFDENLATAVSIEAEQRNRLKRALESRELAMYFQPMVDAEHEMTVGYEALARIQTRSGTLLKPASFLESISSTALMWELDQAAFELSCQALAMLSRIDSEAIPYVACNFSSVSVNHPEFLPMLQYAVERAGVEPSQISIELTESAAFDVSARGNTHLDDMVGLGFKLALDDFGTGYSSLSHLRDLPISTLKVDRSFITKIRESPSERSIAGAIVNLARDLDFDVVAEGVENAEHLRHARELGFPTIQGWYYSGALSVAEALQDWAEAAEKTRSLPAA